MAITAIGRYFVGNPNIVSIVTDDILATITGAGYLTGAAIAADIEALNNGVFEWANTDIVLISYAPDFIVNWFKYDADNATFVANPAAGGLSNSLLDGRIFVGNVSNVAAGVVLSGAATINNAGVLSLASHGVDYAQLAVDVAATATVALTDTQIKGMYATPVQILASPGTGKLNLIDEILWDVAYGTTPYAAGGSIQAQYGNTVHGVGPQASGSILASALNGFGASGFLSNASGSATLVVASSAALATAVYISNATAAFTTGDSTATLYIKYRIVTPA